MKKHVVFVCTGNVCRSPMAEGLFRAMVDGRGDFRVESAGLAAYPGQPASSHTLKVLRQEGVDLNGFRSQPLTDRLIREATHLFCMTEGHRMAIEMEWPQAADKTYLVCEFCADEALMGEDVPDPIGLGYEAYVQTRDTLKTALPSVLAYIESTFGKKAGAAAAEAPSSPPAAPAAAPAAAGSVTASSSPPATIMSQSAPTAAAAASRIPAAELDVKEIYVGADHGGVELKDAVVRHLQKTGHAVKDLGTFGKESVDYPDFVPGVVAGVLADPSNRGILVCTTGIGMSIAANRHPGIQAAIVTDKETAEITRRHNQTNVLCLTGQTSAGDAEGIVDTFLSTPFDGGRHQRRVDKMQGPAVAFASIEVVERTDPQIAALIRAEEKRQAENIELIASENFTSRAVMAAQGSCLTNKYAEGYPGKRWYGGCENVDVVEQLAIDRAKELFGAEHANVQPHSGSQANAAVYFSVLTPGDRILTMNLAHGGHLTHGHQANFSGKFYQVTHYGVSERDERIDYDALQKQAEEVRPKMITAGASAYPRIIDFERMAAIAKSVGAYLFVDMAHIAGLVAAGVHPSPIRHADFVTSTTHKSLRGPRGGIILCRADMAKKIDGQVFPGVQGGPLMHVIAAKAVCFHEALQPGFKDYQQQIAKNAAVLAAELAKAGFRIVSGGTDNHLMLVDLRPKDLNGKIAQETLDEAGITVNKNSIPFDTNPPTKPAGIRVGTPAVTTRGMKEAEMVKIAGLMSRALASVGNVDALHAIRAEVRDLNRAFPLPA